MYLVDLNAKLNSVKAKCQAANIRAYKFTQSRVQKLSGANRDMERRLCETTTKIKEKEEERLNEYVNRYISLKMNRKLFVERKQKEAKERKERNALPFKRCKKK